MGFFCVPPQAGADGLAKTLRDVRPDTFPTVYLAGGCFWCTEWEFRRLEGVVFTRVGYMGGTVLDPTYRDITTGQTGHAETIEVTYDPDLLTYDRIIAYFLTDAHDPTQLNRQGVDVGTHYRSTIFVANDAERALARAVIDREQARFSKPIVTALENAGTFYVGEEYHQNYYEKYKDQTGQDHIRVQIKERKK